MGMAASQARLLSLTARIHDVEYEAQALQNAKINLSTQSDRVYEDYLAALDDTTLTVLKMDDAGNKSTITANFNNLCSVNKVKTANGKSYAIFDERGRLIVDNDAYEAYEKFINQLQQGQGDCNNGICFAMYAMGKTADASLFDAEENVYNTLNKTSDSTLAKYRQNVFDVLNDLHDDYSWISTDKIYNNLENDDEIDPEDKQAYENALLAYRNELYLEAGEKVYEKAKTRDGAINTEYNGATFQYYVSLFNQIQTAGGCVSIDEFNNGDSYSNAANDSEWLKAMIESGRFTIAQVVTDSKTKKTSFDMTSPSSDTVISYTATTEIDKTALAKAEAEYEHNMASINKKDERFDLELSKLEAERTALTTEYDSVKKVIEDNIDRTFGIFS